MIKPILRWVGSKRSQAVGLAKELFGSLRPGGRYFEPFLGSASVALAMRSEGLEAERMFLSDGLETLIETYRAFIRYTQTTIENYQEVLGKFERSRSRNAFNNLRAKVNLLRRQKTLLDGPRPELAAHFLYLNVRGFNGLCRENKSGDFNMTIGRSGYKNTNVRGPSKEEIEAFADELEGTHLYHLDFEEMIRQAGAGDLVYADPPYDGTFNAYSKEWKPSDQERLAKALLEANQRGATIFASNADTERIRALYSWCEVRPRIITWQVGGAKARRMEGKEVLLVGKPVL